MCVHTHTHTLTFFPIYPIKWELLDVKRQIKLKILYFIRNLKMVMSLKFLLLITFGGKARIYFLQKDDFFPCVSVRTFRFLQVCGLQISHTSIQVISLRL